MSRMRFFLLAAVLTSTAAATQELEEAPEKLEVDEEEDAGEYEGYVYLEATLVRERVEDVLSRPEFARLRAEPKPADDESTSVPGWLDRLAEWLDSLLGSRQRGEESASPSFRFGSGGFLLLLMPAAILIAALVFVGKAVVRSAREKRVETEESAKPLFGPGAAPGEMSPAEYWRSAHELAERRDYKGAIRQLLLAAMSTLERRGLIRFRRGLTNRDYIWAAKGPSQASLAAIVRQFEHVYFGRREATAEGYSECLRELEKGFPLETP